MPNALQEQSLRIQKDIDSILNMSRMSKSDIKRLDELTSEAQAVQKGMESVKAAEAAKEGFKASTGMLRLSDGSTAPTASRKAKEGVVEITGIDYAGSETFKSFAKKIYGGFYGGLELLDQDGEGLLDQGTFKTISDPEYKRAFKAYIRSAGLEGAMPGKSVKTLNEGLDASGGYFVTDDILARVVAKVPTTTRIAGLVTQLQTSKDALAIPKVNYQTATDDTTGNLYSTPMRVTWTGEIPTSATAANVVEPPFGMVRIPVYTAMMRIALSLDFIEDASFPVLSWVSGKFGETVDLLRDFITIRGSGAGQPTGILPALGTVNQPGQLDRPAVINTAGVATITADDIQQLVFALPEQYDDAAVMAMSRTQTGPVVATLKDGAGRYMWGMGALDSGLTGNYKTRQLGGYDLSYSGFMPGTNPPTSGTFPIAFGDFGGYYLVNRVGFSVTVVREKYVENNQLALVGRVRFGGDVVEPWRIKVLKVA